jgi:phosphatidylserine/phosphatidylglycerophosphate/cardiolipin synthase-like enzyme
VTRIEILSTHPDILKLGVCSTEPSMVDLIRGARDELQIIPYAVTMGANKTLLKIAMALTRGVKLTFIVNRNEELSEKVLFSLHSLKDNYTYSKIYMYSPDDRADPHAKIMVAER